MPDDIKRPTLLPFRGASREDGQNGEVRVNIVNARHWSDVCRFADQNHLAQAFTACWARLIAVAAGYAAAREPYQFQGETVPGAPGRGFVLEVHPEAFTRQSTPSFEWQLLHEGRPALTGGMIFDEHDRSWTLHT